MRGSPREGERAARCLRPRACPGRRLRRGRGHLARPAQGPGPLSRGQTRGRQGAPAARRAANLSAPCPSNHLQVQIIAETRPKCDAPRRPTPGPGGTTLRAHQGCLRRPSALRPRALHQPPTQPGWGGGTPLRLRRTARAPPLAPAARRVSPRPLTSLWLPLPSPGVAPGRRGGRGRDAGPPPCWADT